MSLNDDGLDPFEAWLKAKLAAVEAFQDAFVYFDLVQGINDLPYVRLVDDGGGPNSLDFSQGRGRGIVERPNKLVIVADPDKSKAKDLTAAFDSVFEAVAWQETLSDGTTIIDSLPLFNWRPQFKRADTSGTHRDMWTYRRWYEFKTSRLTGSGRVGG